MRREPPVRIREGLGVQFPRATRLVILCRSPEDADRALAMVQEWTAEAGLTLHPTKTRIVNASGAMALTSWAIGSRRYDATRGRRAWTKFKDTIRAKTKRTSGESLQESSTILNPTLRGWFEYFKHSHH